jgi:hypothetical protein
MQSGVIRRHSFVVQVENTSVDIPKFYYSLSIISNSFIPQFIHFCAAFKSII